VSKVLFLPFGLAGGILAGLIGKKTFEGVWSLVDDEQAPDPKQREVAWRKLIPALLLEGAIFRIARGLADHGARIAFSRLVGAWPGDERARQT
jgi:Protein of unknown function (DUF4235)